MEFRSPFKTLDGTIGDTKRMSLSVGLMRSFARQVTDRDDTHTLTESREDGYPLIVSSFLVASVGITSFGYAPCWPAGCVAAEAGRAERSERRAGGEMAGWQDTGGYEQLHTDTVG
jgi:hypothetical protein